MDRPTKSYEQVKAMLGSASAAWEKLTGYIRYHYMMDELWDEGKPTHKHRNNLRIRRGGKTLITLCIRDSYFIACVVLGKDEREKFDAQRGTFGEDVCKIYDETHIYHDGKWLGFDITDDSLIDDIIRLLHIKRKPNRKIFPESLEHCSCLDLGLSYQEITDCIMS